MTETDVKEITYIARKVLITTEVDWSHPLVKMWMKETQIANIIVVDKKFIGTYILPQKFLLSVTDGPTLEIR